MNSIDRKIFGTLFFSIFAALTGVGIVVPLLRYMPMTLEPAGFTSD